eukprot:15366643-Ditylum_brightwellii.AAC.2
MCDDEGATVTVVKCSDGYIFGGYTDVAWGQSGEWKSSAKSFMFSLKDHAGIGPVKMPMMEDVQYQYAVYHHSRYGPCFGSGHDLIIDLNAKANTLSYCIAGNNYQLPNNTTDHHFLTGSQYFTVSEYEVFLVESHHTGSFNRAILIYELFDSSDSLDYVCIFRLETKWKCGFWSHKWLMISNSIPKKGLSVFPT